MLVLPHLNRDLDVERIDDSYQMDVNLTAQTDQDGTGCSLESVLVHPSRLMVVPRRMVIELVAVC